ncbi:MAG: glycosyltransferase family 4 protein, partial [Candidatus Hodarchaeota archaeon]
IFKLVRFIKENKVDIVHTSIRLADWYGRVSAKLAGVPLIFSTIHNTDYWRRERRYFLYSMIDRLTMTFNTHIIALSNGIKKFLVRWQRVNPDKITVIPYGTDVKRYIHSRPFRKPKDLPVLESDVPTIGVTARLAEQKGLHILLQAARYILETGRGVQLLIVGDGPLRGDLEKLAKKLEIDQHVIFTGFRSDIPTILPLLDVFVMSSIWEGLGLSAIEAMLAGKPVVASNVDGLSEVVLDQETGILVPPGEPKVLADAICTLLDSPEKRREMGEKGRQRAITHFTIDRMVRDYEEFYDSHTGVR